MRYEIKTGIYVIGDAVQMHENMLKTTNVIGDAVQMQFGTRFKCMKIC